MAINLPIVSKYDDKGVKNAEASLQKFGKVAAGVAAAATAAVTGIAVASIKEFANFDSKLNQSIAIMGDVSEAMRGEMSDAAREVAKATTFSADQAAESFFFLASAGLSAEASIAAMPQVAKFAQAGMFDMALATDLATDAQSALGLSSKDAEENLANLTRVTDVFVKANTLANTSVEQLATAFTTKAGTALKTVGKDVEEGAAALALFADQGIKGEIAGTQLTNTIFGLTDRAQKAPGAFEALGISVFDASGNMRNFADIADQFGAALGDMTTEQKVAELAQLGFTKQARAGILALMGNGDALRNYEEQLRSAGGTVDEVANKQLNTMSAQFELLKSRLADVGIEIGSKLAPALLGMVDQLGPIIDQLAPQFIAFFEGLVPVIVNVSNFLANDLIPALTGIFTGFSDNKEIVGFFVVTLGTFLIAMNAVIAATKLQAAAMAALTFVMNLNPFVLIATAVAVLAAGVIYLATQTTFFQDSWRAMTETAALVWEGFVSFFISVGEGIVTFFSETTQSIATSWSRMLEAISEALGKATEFISGVWDGMIEAIKMALGSVVGFFAEVFARIGVIIKGYVNAYISLFEGFVNGAISGINLLIGALNKIQLNIPSTPFSPAFSFGVNIPSIPQVRIPRLAEGGIVMPRPGGVFANLAEAGKPEAVIPLDRLGSLGGNNYTINVNAGIGTDGGRVGQLIVDEIKRFERANGPVFASA